MQYDPDHAPDNQKWLQLDDGQRQEAVRVWHQMHGEQLPNERVHAIFHAVIETQLASDDPPEARRTMRRLRRQGLDRHDALHAMASVLASQISELMQGASPPSDTDAGTLYARDLKKLTAESWLNEVQ